MSKDKQESNDGLDEVVATEQPEAQGEATVKKPSRAKTRILWCLLGILFGLIIAAASVFGVCMYALNANINNVFGMFGQKNDDGKGNALINADKSTGGVSSVLDLYNEIQSMTSDLGSLTVGRMVQLSPALGAFLDDLYIKADEYGVTVNGEELNSTPVVDLGTYLQDVVYGIKPSVLMRKLELSDAVEQHAVISAMLEGLEATYVYAQPNGEGDKYPLFYDEYTYSPELEKYFRTTISDNIEVFPANIDEGWLMESNKSDEDGNAVYRLYYYLVTVGEGDGAVNYYIVTKKGDGGAFIFNGAGKPADELNYDLQVSYGENFQRATGNWYFDNQGNKTVLSSVTFKTLSEEAIAPLYYLPVSSLLGDGEVVSALFGMTSVGELLDGQVDLSLGVEKLTRKFAESLKTATVSQLVGLGIISESPEDEYIPVSVGFKTVDGRTVTVYYRMNVGDCTLEDIISCVALINEEGYAHALLGDEGYEFADFAQ